MSSHAILVDVSKLPVTRHLVEHVIPLPDDVQQWVFVVCATDQQDRIMAALPRKIAVVVPHDEQVKAKADPRTLADVQALAWALTVIFDAPASAPFITDQAYLLLSAFALETTDRALVRAALQKAGLSVSDAASLPAGPPIDDKTAIATALAPFKEHFAPAAAAAMDAYLRDPKAPIPAVLQKARSEYYGDEPASVIGNALSGDALRWNPRTSAKLMDLWMALRHPLEVSLCLGLGEESLAPDLGQDRTRTIAAALESRGLAPALAALAASSCEGSSNWFFAPTLLAHPEVFAEALAVDRGIARSLAARALRSVTLFASPSFRAHADAFLASHSEALGTEALLTLPDEYSDVIDDRHLVNACVEAEPTELCKLAAKLVKQAPKRHAGTIKNVSERWIGSLAPKDLVSALDRVVEREAEGLDANVAWDRILDLFTKSPTDPFGDGEDGALRHFDYLVCGAIAKPTDKTKARLVTFCETMGDKVGPTRLKWFEKKAGIKRKEAPLPYDAADLSGLSPELAKAWQTARTKSWKAGIRLPQGAGKAVLAAAEKTLGAKLPADVRSFYQLHDGAGDDECFRGCRLYGIAEALEKRKWLMEVNGKPFDAAWLPVTDDGAGNHHCVVLSGPKAGTVIDFDHEAGGGRTVAKSFAALVQGAGWGG